MQRTHIDFQNRFLNFHLLIYNTATRFYNLFNKFLSRMKPITYPPYTPPHINTHKYENGFGDNRRLKNNGLNSPEAISVHVNV